MGNESSRPAAYQMYYAAMQQQQALPEALLAGLDPYEVLGVAPGVSWEDLKMAYRRTARLVHPDKGGTQQLFNVVSDCFRRLAQEFKAAEEARMDHAARRAASEAAQAAKPTAPPPPPVAATPTNPKDFSKAFNTFFDQHRPEDLEGNDDGYGDMMAASGGPREDLKVQRVLTSFKSQKAFNAAFEKHAAAPAPPAPSKALALREPQPLTLARAIKFTELGAERPTEFTKDAVQASAAKELPFTDYKAAYSTGRLFNPTEVAARPSYKGLEDYKKARSSAVEVAATPEELAAREAAVAAEARQEAERLQRLRQRDERTAAHHARVTAARIAF